MSGNNKLKGGRVPRLYRDDKESFFSGTIGTRLIVQTRNVNSRKGEENRFNH